MQAVNWSMPVGAVMVVALLLSSCGSGDDEDHLLRLPGEEMTESELRDRWRTQLAQAPTAGATVCAAIVGSEPDDVLAYFELDVTSATFDRSMLRDVRRAAEIIEEECASSSTVRERGF
jgi:hypothetical protein